MTQSTLELALLWDKINCLEEFEAAVRRLLAEQRERDARVCEDRALELNELGEWASGGFVAEDCAKRIRSGG